MATATADSKHCAGSITIVKTLNPRTDDGRFNLEIDGKVAGGAAGVGDGGTTGTIAVDSGSRTVGESAATGTSLSDYDTQIICVSGTKTVAQGNATSIGVTVSNGEAVLCTITNTLKLASTLEPILECVVFRGGAPDTAVWGYSNPNAFPVSVDAGPTNGFTPAPIVRGQPTIFVPGRLVGAFQSPFSGAASLTWTLGRKTVTASGSSARCTATLELRKVTVPADDPGLFNLQVNGQLWAIGGNGTTTGPITVGVGEGTVSETAGPGTDLSNYDSRVECTRNGTVKVSVPGTKVDGVVGTGDVVVCTFTNTRKSTAPPPGPKPPTPPQPPLPPAPAPPPPLGDLSVVKSASPTSTVVGKKIRWTVTVTNNSTVAAADANVVRVSERAYRLNVISVTPSQGTCTLKGCDLGRLAPGAKATITVVTTAAKAGRVLNVVRVTSEEQESNYLNNTAAAGRAHHPAAPGIRRRRRQGRLGRSHVQHPRRAAAVARDRQHLDRAGDRPESLRQAPQGSESACRGCRGEPDGHDGRPRRRPVRAHPRGVRHRPLPARCPTSHAGAVELPDAPGRPRRDDPEASDRVS